MVQRVVVVTGGSSGIGRGIALAFADEGDAVVVGDVREQPKENVHFDDSDRPTHELIANEGGEAAFVQTDVSEPDQCERLVRETVDQFGRIDVWVNNAGLHSEDYPETAESLAVEEWHKVMCININGQFYCSKYALPELKKTEGSIVNMSSVQGRVAAHCPAYSASKAATLNFTRDLAVAYGPDNVNVNAICPGPVRTPNWNYLSEEEVQETLQEVEQGESQTVLPRLGLPEDIGRAAVFLTSDDAEWITGEALTVDGGYSAHLG